MTFWLGLVALTCGGIGFGASLDAEEFPVPSVVLMLVGIALLIGSHYA